MKHTFNKSDSIQNLFIPMVEEKQVYQIGHTFNANRKSAFNFLG